MEFDFATLPRAGRYKLMASCIAPRPIAWITSLSGDGLVNAAPYSFFNMLGDDPPTIVVGMMAHGDARLKDTAANIRTSGEFVVNIVSEDHAAAMNATCINAPPEVSEVDLAGLTLAPSSIVAPPRIATVPASFECRALHIIETGRNQLAVIGEVVFAHVADIFVEDSERLHIDTPAMGLVGRLHGAGWYARTTDRFQLARPTWQDRTVRNAS